MFLNSLICLDFLSNDQNNTEYILITIQHNRVIESVSIAGGLKQMGTPGVPSKLNKIFFVLKCFGNRGLLKIIGKKKASEI